jgi:enoyl-CoA hydratase/carnithine racemase
MSERSPVAYEVEEPVATIQLDRERQLNAFTYAMIDEIRAAADRAAGDERVVGIVITGSGRGFSAGMDMTELGETAGGAAGPSPSPDPDDLPALFSHLLRVPKPVIAAVNGVAAGGGFVLAMMCDLRFASENASFTTSFSKRGLIAEHGTSWILPRLVGASRALDLLWSSRRIDAVEALRIGFVDRIVPQDRLLEESKAYVRELAASVSPRSLAIMKSQIYRHLSLPLDAACHDAERLMQEALGSPEAREGVDSFVERRPPRFPRLKKEKP